MLFKMSQLDDIAAGKITVAYRRWTRPTVKEGGTLRTPACVLAIDEVRKLPQSARITKKDALAAGFASVEALQKALKEEGDLYRVRFHPAGQDERDSLRARIATDADDVAALERALAKLDNNAPAAWTLDTLALIEAHPATLAATLADKARKAKLAFKEDVRKLKGLGLTESLDVGYRLSPRGAAWLDRVRPSRAKPRADEAPRLPDDVIAALTKGKIVGVRAGDAHRFVAVWPIVVDGRLYVRSWSRTDGGWWRAFTSSATRDGTIHVQLVGRSRMKTEREVRVRAARVTEERVLDAVDAEYRRKYKTPGAQQYVKDLCSAACRATTVELAPRDG